MANIKNTNELEKFYTPETITNFLLDILDRNFKNKTTEILEPCSGDGRMVDVIQKRYPNIPILKYDIIPDRDDIIQMDFLNKKENKLIYKKGRVAILNPPFKYSIPFIRKAIEICDYVVSIAGPGTIINLDYDEFNVDELYYIKNARFYDIYTEKELNFKISIFGINNNK